MFFSATKHHIVFTFPGILCKWIFPDRSVAIENWCDATAATRTRPCSIWPYASELAVRLFVLLLLLSPVKCQTFCYFPNDCRQFLIVHWARGSTWGGSMAGTQSANTFFEMIYMCPFGKICLEFEWLLLKNSQTRPPPIQWTSDHVLALCCCFRESLKLFIVFNTKKCEIQRSKYHFIVCNERVWGSIGLRQCISMLPDVVIRV